MTDNSKNQPLEAWLLQASTALKNNGIASAHLDAELMAANVLSRSRTWVHAHTEHQLSITEQGRLNSMLTERLTGQPLAYIFGSKEFYGRNFMVTADVLVPRPESETMITCLKKVFGERSFIDIGTGSGALAVTAALEHPKWTGTATDISARALKVAKQNAKILGAVNLVFKRQNLLINDPTEYDLVLANLPYVPTALRGKTDIAHEPDIALFAGADGLDVYRQLFTQLAARANKPADIFTESLLEQHQAMATLAETAGYQLLSSDGLIQHFGRSN